MVDQRWFRYHDRYNLVTLPIVALATIMYQSQTDEALYYYQYTIFFIYLLIDTLWLLLKPDSVASVSTVLPHHFVCLIGWNLTEINKLYSLYNNLPIHDAKYDRFISTGAFVEVNTFLLILRRNVSYNPVLELSFYVSWFYIRCFMYPRSFISILNDYITVITNQNQYLCIELFIILFFIPLNLLNLKWTVDLIARYFQKSSKHYKGAL